MENEIRIGNPEILTALDAFSARTMAEATKRDAARAIWGLIDANEKGLGLVAQTQEARAAFDTLTDVYEVASDTSENVGLATAFISELLEANHKDVERKKAKVEKIGALLKANAEAGGPNLIAGNEEARDQFGSASFMADTLQEAIEKRNLEIDARLRERPLSEIISAIDRRLGQAAMSFLPIPTLTQVYAVRKPSPEHIIIAKDLTDPKSLPESIISVYYPEKLKPHNNILPSNSDRIIKDKNFFEE